MPVTLDCVVGLGANLGNREQTLTTAVVQLAAVGRVIALSNLYENGAVGGPPQPDYLNAAVRLQTELAPLALLGELLRLELLAGRERLVKWGPRTLDLDLLWIGETSLELDGLTVPHPRLLERPFALLPLVEVAPDTRCPRSGQRYTSALEVLGTECLRLVATADGPPWQWHRQRPTSCAHTGLPHPEPGLSNAPEK